jgi:hypothetical protein
MPQKAGGTRLAGMRLPKGWLSPGVRAVDRDNPSNPCVEPSIRLRESAAFQLLLFATNQRVRDAAARALEPRARVGDSEMKCHDSDFGSLPFAERIAARLLASLYDESAARASLFGAVPHTTFELTPPCPAGDATNRVYRLIGGSVRRWQDGGRHGRWFYRLPATFVLPSRPEQLFRWPLQSIQRLGEWSLDERSPVRMRFQRSRELGRARTNWDAPRLFDPEGRLECTLSNMPGNPLLASLDVDPSLLMRLVTGRLAGYTIAFRRASRTYIDGTIEASIELGELDRKPPLLVGFRGSFQSTLDIDSPLVSREVEVPLVEGATLDCLDAIARRTGVRFGDSLRGSFLYHPSRASARKEVA